MIDIWKQKIKRIVLNELKDLWYKVFLFWSRVWNNYRKNSDYDIWILWDKPLDIEKYLELKMKLNELHYLIDLVDFSRVDKKFKEIALKNIEEWN